MTAAGKPAATRADLDALADLQALPSIGPRLAEKLLLLGVRSPAGLRGRDPEALYDELQSKLGPVDRCVLYAFRCAVYAAGHDAEHDPGHGSDRGGEHGAADPELAKWWNWKDGGLALRRARAAAK
ncbi:MAG TPA: helix-hairpin-helix domain-containing protein [Thermoleophilia bacterium]|nr:helix-hairpin-helix domain-containing protein [Thermoleophilia bacterium]